MRGRRYKPKKHDGSVTFFRPYRGDYAILFRNPRWGRGNLALRGVDAQDAPGKHSSLMAEPHVGELANKFKRCLRAAQQEAHSG